MFPFTWAVIIFFFRFSLGYRRDEIRPSYIGNTPIYIYIRIPINQPVFNGMSRLWVIGGIDPSQLLTVFGGSTLDFRPRWAPSNPRSWWRERIFFFLNIFCFREKSFVCSRQVFHVYIVSIDLHIHLQQLHTYIYIYAHLYMTGGDLPIFKNDQQ